MKLSYSAVSTLQACGERYRLTRVLGYRGKPNWAQVGGTIFHKAIENYELEQHGAEFDALMDPRRNWGLAMDEEATNVASRAGIPVDEVRPTGKKLVTKTSMSGGPNKKDRDWWVEYLPIMYDMYVNWSKAMPYPLWILPDGTPALEVSFEFHTPTGAHVRGFIDQVRVLPDGTLYILDAKTGNEPYGDAQLGTYKVGLAAAFPDAPPATYGSFYLAQEGGSSTPADLSGYTPERIDWEYGAAKERVERGDFQPHVSRDCSWCDVRTRCYAVHGENSAEVALPWPTVKEN